MRASIILSWRTTSMCEYHFGHHRMKSKARYGRISSTGPSSVSAASLSARVGPVLRTHTGTPLSLARTTKRYALNTCIDVPTHTIHAASSTLAKMLLTSSWSVDSPKKTISGFNAYSPHDAHGTIRKRSIHCCSASKSPSGRSADDDVFDDDDCPSPDDPVGTARSFGDGRSLDSSRTASAAFLSSSSLTKSGLFPSSSDTSSEAAAASRGCSASSWWFSSASHACSCRRVAPAPHFRQRTRWMLP
mmetsp:Transcript_2341/g.7279  ORF Transcript_2341/g.7279 Transcript_2341/m.7279 type:complete len:246 (-) Transcript_2341:564-1301(-)